MRKKNPKVKRSLMSLREEEIKFAHLIMEGHGPKDAYLQSGLQNSACPQSKSINKLPSYYLRKVGPYIRKCQEIIIQESLKGLIANVDEALCVTTYEMRNGPTSKDRLTAAKMLMDYQHRKTQIEKDLDKNPTNEDKIVILMPAKNKPQSNYFDSTKNNPNING